MRLQGFNAAQKRQKREQLLQEEREKKHQNEINELADLQHQLDQLNDMNLEVSHHSSRDGRSSASRDGRSSNQERQSINQRGSILSNQSNRRKSRTRGDDHMNHDSQAKDNASLDKSHGDSKKGPSGLSGLLAQGIMNGKNGSAAESTDKKDENLLSVSKMSQPSPAQSQKFSNTKFNPGAMSSFAKQNLTGTQIVKLGGKSVRIAAGEFRVGHRIIKRVPKALCCITNRNSLRKAAAIVSEHHIFDKFIIACILANCITMASRDFIDSDDETTRNQILNYFDIGFSVVFVLEAMIKILANGFVLGQKTYLRDPWNVIDFLIVIAAIFDFITTLADMESDALDALKSIRVLRVLRPLKALKTLTSLRKQVSALLNSLKRLANVLVFLFAMFILCGVMGLQLFNESVHYACRLTEEPETGASTWAKLEPSHICSQNGNNDWDSYGAYQCPEGSFCGSPLDYGLEPDEDIQNDINYQYGFAIFANILDSIFTVFQIITLDNWSQIMYNLAFAESFYIPSIFCTAIVFIGSFFMLNLMLAVIMDSYEQSSEVVDQLLQQQLEQEKKEIEERIANTASLLDQPELQQYTELNQILDRRQKNMMDHIGKKIRAQIFGQLGANFGQQHNTVGAGGQGTEGDPSPSSGLNLQPKPSDKNDGINGSEMQSINEASNKKEEDSAEIDLDREILEMQTKTPYKPTPPQSSMMQGFSSALMKNSILSVGGSGSAVASAGAGSGTPQPNQQQQLLAAPAGSVAQKQSPSAAEGTAKPGTSSLTKVVGGALALGFLKEPSEAAPAASQNDRDNGNGDAEVEQLARSNSEIEQQEEQDELKLKKINTLNMEKLHQMSVQSPNIRQSQSLDFPRGATLVDRLKNALGKVVRDKQKELSDIEMRAKSLREPEAQAAFKGIHDRALAAVNMKDLNNKYMVNEQIKAEGNLMMLKLKEGLKEKYLSKNGGHFYGLKDEGKTMGILRKNISSSLNQYKRHITLSQKKRRQSAAGLPRLSKHQSVPNQKSQNPLAAVFALAAQKREEEARAAGNAGVGEDSFGADEGSDEVGISLKVQNSLAKGQLNSQDQIRLVMDIQSQAQKQMMQKEIIAKMAGHLKNIVLEKNDMQEIIDDTNDIVEQDILQVRASKNFIYRKCLHIVQSKSFEIIISVCIVLNTFVLGMDSYPTDIQLLIFIEWANLIFFLTFFFEMVIKMLGLGIKIYFNDTYNIFDFIVIVFSVADLIALYFTSSLNNSGMKAIQALRVFRLLRVFKLAKIWPEFSYILGTIGKTLKKISAFSVLLLIFIFSFSILGMELFAAKCSFDESDVPIVGDYADGIDEVQGRIPDSNFNNFFDAVLSVFIVLANDGWSTIFFDHARAFRADGQSTALPTIFFIMLIIIGQNILFQLFLAILLQEFDERSLIIAEIERRQAEKNKNKLTKMQKLRAKFVALGCKCCKESAQDDEDENGDNKDDYQNDGASGDPSKKDQSKSLVNQTDDNLMLNRSGVLDRQPSEQAVNDDQQGGGGVVSQPSDRETNKDKKEEEPKDENEEGEDPAKDAAPVSTNRSLFIFDENNSIRKLMMKIEKSTYFQNGILLMIIISSIALAFENPLNDPDSTLSRILINTDIVMTIIFAVEVIIKVISHGLLFNGKQSYLREVWNILDFIVVIIAVISLSMPSDGADIGTLKILRMGRLVRPLRVLSRNEGLRISIQALLVSVPAMLRLMMIVALFFLIFAIMGITLFKGYFEECDISQTTLTEEQLSLGIRNKYDCINYGGDWITYGKNFNNMGQSIMQTITMSQTVGWAEFMYRAMYSRGPGQQPDTRDKSYIPALYYIFYVIFGAFFITNLFVGVVISTYNREKDRLGNNFLLSEDQKKWIETKLLVVRVTPKRRNLRPQNKCRSLMFSISENKYFEYFIMFCIFLNAIVMAIKHVGMSDDLLDVLQFMNWSFTAIFFIEMIIRLLAYGKNYFKDYWYVFDFSIVVGSSILIIVSLTSSSGDNLTTFVTAARLLRIGRLLRLFRQMKSLQVIFSTFLTTLPHMLNVGGIMILIIFVYSVIGISLFAEIKHNGPMGKFLGFTGFYKSFITLIRIATGENWNVLMIALSRQNEPSFDCKETPTYQDFVDAGYEPQGCGNSVVTQVYFISYIFLVGLIFLNLFIAIILQGYYQTTELEKQVVNSEIMARYKDAWAEYDPEATGYIEASKFADLMLTFGPPLGWDDSFREKRTKQALFFKLLSQFMKTYDNHKYVQFSDVLDAVTLFYIIKQEVKEEMEAENVRFVSDDDSDSNESGDSDEYGEEQGESESDSDSEDQFGFDGSQKPEESSSSSDGGDSNHDGRNGPSTVGAHQLLSARNSAAQAQIEENKGPTQNTSESKTITNSSKSKAPKHRKSKTGIAKKLNKTKVMVSQLDHSTGTQAQMAQVPQAMTAFRSEPPKPSSSKGNRRKKRESSFLEDKFLEKATAKQLAEKMDQSSMVKDLVKKQNKRKGKKKSDLQQDKTLKQDQLTQLLGMSMNQNDRSGTELIDSSTRKRPSEAIQENENGSKIRRASMTQRLGIGMTLNLTSEQNSAAETSSMQTDYFPKSSNTQVNSNAVAQSSRTTHPTIQREDSVAKIEQEFSMLQSEYQASHGPTTTLKSPKTPATVAINGQKSSFIAGVDVIREEDEFMEEEIARINNLSQINERNEHTEMPRMSSQNQDSFAIQKLVHRPINDRSQSDVYQVTSFGSTQRNLNQLVASGGTMSSSNAPQNNTESDPKLPQRDNNDSPIPLAVKREQSNVSALISQEIERMDMLESVPLPAPILVQKLSSVPDSSNLSQNALKLVATASALQEVDEELKQMSLNQQPSADAGAGNLEESKDLVIETADEERAPIEQSAFQSPMEQQVERAGAAGVSGSAASNMEHLLSSQFKTIKEVQEVQFESD